MNKILSNRLSNIKNKIPENSALLIEDPVNLLYYTGIHLSAGALFITPNEVELFVDGRYLENCKKESDLNCALLDNDNITLFLIFYKIEKLFFNANTTTYQRHSQLSEDLDINIAPFNESLCHFRKIKDSAELNYLQQAAELGSKGYEFLKESIVEGISEKELSKELNLFWIKEGADGLAFDSCIAFGKNTAYPHHHSNDDKLENNTIILADIGVKLNDYCSDMTRMIPYGTVSEKIKDIYKIVLEAQTAAIDFCKAGVTVGELDQVSRKIISQNGYGDFFTHSLGHGIGLNVHEFPYISNRTNIRDTVLEENMVITIEPGIYLPEIGGVRIEDTVIVQNNHIINLSTPSKNILS